MRLSLNITNTYEDGDKIKTQVTDVEVPDPDIDDIIDELNDWAQDNIFDFTGTGRTKGDAWYDVTVTASSRPDLVPVGREFDFGY